MKLGTKERKEREKEQRREQILKISEKLFLKKDIENVTMDEIAGECELGKGTLYIYFKSKEEIFLNIIHKAVSLLCDIFTDAAVKIDNPVRKLRAMGEGYIAFYEKYPAYFKLMKKLHDYPTRHPIQEKPGTKEIHRKILEKTNDIWKFSHDIIVDGIKKGIFRKKIDPVEISVSLWAISTIFIGILDNLKSFDHTAFKNMPLNRLDVKTLLMTNGKRIIYSILKNPPDFDDMK